jgi:MoaA/NifB/PqqE/SkfB family radical SAM enzyme
MNPTALTRYGQNLLSAVEINVNRLMERELIPNLTDMIAIEPTSVCNLKCSFCAYEKKQSPKISMKHDRFTDYLAQAVAMGYRRFALTPNTGDIFMDRHIFGKLQFLEDHPNVDEYFFFTNFTVLDAEKIHRLIKLEKLKRLTISIYGHDRETFVTIAKSTDKVYRRLMHNLETLLTIVHERCCALDIAIRSTRDMPRGPSTDLLKLLDRFKQAGIPVKRTHLYHDWGGAVAKSDQQGLAIDLLDSSKIYKNGACALLFNAQIMATGVVHACSCIDVNATLKIGDLNEKPLREIISTKNPIYMGLIEEQQRGLFKSICQSCGFYKSIYHRRISHRKSSTSTVSIDEFKTMLDIKAAASV